MAISPAIRSIMIASINVMNMTRNLTAGKVSISTSYSSSCEGLNRVSRPWKLPYLHSSTSSLEYPLSRWGRWRYRDGMVKMRRLKEQTDIETLIVCSMPGGVRTAKGVWSCWLPKSFHFWIVGDGRSSSVARGKQCCGHYHSDWLGLPPESEKHPKRIFPLWSTSFRDIYGGVKSDKA